MCGKIFFFCLSLALSISLIPGDVLSLEYPTREIELIAGYPPGVYAGPYRPARGQVCGEICREAHCGSQQAWRGGTEGFPLWPQPNPTDTQSGLCPKSAILQPYLMKGITFNYKKSFRIICQVAYTAEGIYAKKGGPFDIPFTEIIKRAKEKPNTIKAGVGGTWTGSDVVRLYSGRCHRSEIYPDSPSCRRAGVDPGRSGWASEFRHW